MLAAGLLLAGCPDFPAHLLVTGDEAGAEASPRGDGGPRDGRSADGTRDAPQPRDGQVDLGADAALDAAADTGTDAAADAPPPDAPPADAPPPDAPPPDAPPPDAPPPDAPPPPDACTVSPAWWNASYAHRVPLTVGEAIVGTLAAGYTVRAVLDTQALVAAGDLLASGDDLRVVRYDGASSTELDRHLIAPNSAQSEIWFKTQAAVDTADASYYVYYGAPGAGAPPAHWADSMGAAALPSAVYLAADDFSGHGAGDAPDGWEGSASYKVELDGSNAVLGVTGSDGPADYFFAGDLGWTDVVLTARQRVITTSGTHYGLWVRANGTSNFRTVFFGLADNSTLQAWNARIASPSATGLTSSSLLQSWNVAPPAGSAWHTVEVRALGGSLRYVYDGAEQGTTNSGAQAQGRVGLCAGYPASRALWDDVVVRRYVAPEPTVSAGPVENRCP